jgi:tetratricopeptide (TPR) repeat protein
MKHSICRSVVRWSAVALASGCFSAANAAGGDTVYLKAGKAMPVTSILWREGNKEYQVVTAEGGAQMTIPLKDVDRLDIGRPADLDKADQLVKGGQPDAAIPILEGVVSKYRMMVWDVQARQSLGSIYLARKDSAKALAALEPLFSAPVSAPVGAGMRRLYWEALLAAGRSLRLQKELDETIATGPRSGAAAAQVMRGNMFLAVGKKDEALSDYLRTVLFFQDVRDVMPEALFRASERLKELGDARAQEYQGMLLQKYPESEFAKKVAGKKE